MNIARPLPRDGVVKMMVGILKNMRKRKSIISIVSLVVVSANIASHLKYVIRYTLTNAECQFVYGNSVRSSNICIDTTGGQSTCSGDSGGPLVINDDFDGPIQIGLTSFGKSSGCTKGYPAVFTRLTSYLEWIYLISGVANF